MIDQECIDELADEIGIKEHVAAITARSMNGEIAFEPALRERVALLKGLQVSVIDRIIENRLTLASGGRQLVATMRANGAWTALVSGGFDAFTGPHRAPGSASTRTTPTGSSRRTAGWPALVAEPILGRAAKAARCSRSRRAWASTPADAIAVGDGANDLDMMALAGTGVALHANPAVAAAARVRIDHGDLTALLYLQGYRRREFVETPIRTDAPHPAQLGGASDRRRSTPIRGDGFFPFRRDRAEASCSIELRADIAGAASPPACGRRGETCGFAACNPRPPCRKRSRSAGVSRQKSGAAATSPKPPAPAALNTSRDRLSEIVSIRGIHPSLDRG